MVTRLLALILLAAPAAAQEATMTCAWLRLSPEAFEEGPCTVEWTADGARVAMGPRIWDIRERERQGRWAAVTINGAPGMRFEIDRGTFSHATADLNETLDVGP